MKFVDSNCVCYAKAKVRIAVMFDFKKPVAEVEATTVKQSVDREMLISTECYRQTIVPIS